MSRNRGRFMIFAFAFILLIELLCVLVSAIVPWFHFADGIYASKGKLFDDLSEAVLGASGFTLTLSFVYLVWCVLKKRSSGIKFSCLLIAMFAVSAVVTGAGEQYLFAGAYKFNFEKSRLKYQNDLLVSPGTYGGISTYTAVDRAIGNEVSKSKKLYVWDLGYAKTGIWLLVYDESDDLDNSKTARRNIGRLCDGVFASGVFECASPRSGLIVSFGASPYFVHRIDGHFYLVRIDDPNSSL